MDKREVTYLVLKDYVVRPDTGLTTYLDLRTKIPNKKQKTRFAITDITNQDFSKFLNKVKNSPCLGYKRKHVHNEPTEAHFFLIKQISKVMKHKTRFRPKFLKSGVNKTIGQASKAIVHINKEIKSKEL